MRGLIFGALGTIVLAGTAAAQDTTAAPMTLEETVRRAQPNQYTVPACDMGSGHFKITSGRTYVQSALNSPENRERIMGDARRVLLEAITQDGQAGKAEAWFWLGRVYLYAGDIAGADSSLAKAKALAPACAQEIDSFRRPTWAALTQPGLLLLNEGKYDEARRYLEQAAAFYDGEPQAFSALGVIAANAGDAATSAQWFEKAVAAAQDSNEVEARGQALFNLGLMYQRLQRHEDAARALGGYLHLVPEDVDAKRALVGSLRAAGMADSALVVERGIAEELTTVGEDASSSDLITAGVTFFNDKQYAEAAAMFEKVLAREPYHRDAAFNLANARLGEGNAGKLIEAGRKLVAIEPMNELAQKLLATGYQMRSEQDTLLALLTAVEAMPFSLQVDNFAPTATGAVWAATATGREPKTISGTPIAPEAVTLVVEFLDQGGAVVATEETTVPALDSGASHTANLAPAGAGIVAWRYRVK